VRKYDPEGNELWTRQFSTAIWADAFALAVDSSGLYVGGELLGALAEHTSAGQRDAFLRKYDRDLAQTHEGDGVTVVGPLIWRPPAAAATTLGDGNLYLVARLHHFYDRTQQASGLEQVRLNNNVALRPLTIPPDSDGDGSSDDVDNCPVTPNADQSDLDGDGRGDVCDGDIDGDGCSNLYDPKPADINDPDEACLVRPLDPLLTRDGRLVQLDPRFDDPRLHALLEGFGPQDPATCGRVDCPPPTMRITDAGLVESLAEIYPADFDLDENSGFGNTALWLPDLDGDDYPELAIAAHTATLDPDRPRAGAVLIVSGQTGKELGRIAGPDQESGFGAALADMGDGILAVGAPGTAETPGSVFLVELETFETSARHSAGDPGDGFGTALAVTRDVDRDDRLELVVGAPAARGHGVVYALLSAQEMRPIASGQAEGDAFGQTLLAIGDLTGEGVPDVLVGAPGAAGDGDAGGEAKETGEIALLDLEGNQHWVQSGSEAGERLGSALAAVAADREQWLVTEVLVGAPGWRNQTGRAYLLTAKGELVAIVSGSTEGAAFGAFVAVGPDFDANRLSSLVVAEPNMMTAHGFGRSIFYER
jgi:hypothetical protein